MLKRDVHTNTRTYITHMHTYRHIYVCTWKRYSLLSHGAASFWSRKWQKLYTLHKYTPHSSSISLSYSLLFFFWGGGDGGGAPLLCVRTFSCKCMCVSVYVNCNNNHQRRSFSPSGACYNDVDGGFLLSIWAQSNNNKKKTLTGTLTSLPASTTTTFFNMASFSLLSSPLVNFISDFWKYAINYAKSAKGIASCSNGEVKPKPNTISVPGNMYCCKNNKSHAYWIG